MTDYNHPITPPPELVRAFLRSNPFTPDGMTYEEFIATRFARWGADQELEACCEWAADQYRGLDFVLRATRRPEPPSLKEQALAALETQFAKEFMESGERDIIRRAIESLPS